MDRPVQVPVPVVQTPPPELTADCPPGGVWPPPVMTVGAALDRVAAVSEALALCRARLGQLRGLGAPPATP